MFNTKVVEHQEIYQHVKFQLDLIKMSSSVFMPILSKEDESKRKIWRL